jgi:hypothetical protein
MSNRSMSEQYVIPTIIVLDDADAAARWAWRVNDLPSSPWPMKARRFVFVMGVALLPCRGQSAGGKSMNQMNISSRFMNSVHAHRVRRAADGWSGGPSAAAGAVADGTARARSISAD